MKSENKIVILAGFLRCGTKSLQKYLEKRGYQVIRLDTDLYCRFIDVAKVLYRAYGDVPVYFIMRKDKKNLERSLRITFWRHRVVRLCKDELDNYTNHKLYIHRFKKYFSNVGIIDLHSQHFLPHTGKTKLKHKILYYIPGWLIIWWKNLKFDEEEIKAKRKRDYEREWV